MSVKSGFRNVRKTIVIAGAGPAGSSLAIRLARAGFKIILLEREKFPRHKLCGEFISPECLLHFGDLGVGEPMLSAGGARIDRTIFFERAGRGVEVPSGWFGTGGAALGLSRAEMDLRLLERAKECGSGVHEGAKVTDLIESGGRIAGLKAVLENGSSLEIEGDIFVDATGRSRVLGKLVEKKRRGSTAKKPSLIGFKAHLKNAEVRRASCEIYSFGGGYGGLSPIEDGLANHCFLVRSGIVREFRGDADEIVKTVVFENARAKAALAPSERISDWLAVSVDGFGIKNLAPAPGVYSAGDAAAFIDPFAGSGMLLALESSELLAGVIGQHADKPEDLSAAYRAAFRNRFGSRLRVCSLLRGSAFSPVAAKFMIAVLGVSEGTRRALTRLTRGNAGLMKQ
jgi:flavin-dependent dehydrogenase